MGTSLKISVAVGGMAMLLGVALWIAEGPRTPPLVHVPTEQVTGRAAGHDVVHALQDIVETGSAFPVQMDAEFIAAGHPDPGSLQAQAALLLAALETSGLSPLAQLNLRRNWELAETPQAQSEALARLRAALLP